jgi:hypothetical protein
MRRTAALIVVLVLVGGCGTSESSLSDTIEGVWVTNLYGIYEVFLDDGTYGVGHSLEQATPTDGTAELNVGTWSVDGNVLTRTADASASYCAGMVATYEVEVLDDGNRLDIVVLEDDCAGPGRADFGSGLTRYSDT